MVLARSFIAKSTQSISSFNCRYLDYKEGIRDRVNVKPLSNTQTSPLSLYPPPNPQPQASTKHANLSLKSLPTQRSGYLPQTTFLFPHPRYHLSNTHLFPQSLYPIQTSTQSPCPLPPRYVPHSFPHKVQL